MTMTEAAEGKIQLAWRCPRCGRIYRQHVFSPSTPASGPMCNACCVALEWVEAPLRGEEMRAPA